MEAGLAGLAGETVQLVVVEVRNRVLEAVTILLLLTAVVTVAVLLQNLKLVIRNRVVQQAHKLSLLVVHLICPQAVLPHLLLL